MDDILKQSRKRPGAAEDDDTSRPHDPLVASIMEEEQATKRAKKGKDDVGMKTQKKKGLTLEEVEELEGGVIKESKVGMAASKRADKRKQKQAGDETEMLPVNDLVDVEEALEQEEDQGVALEPFNLAKEREEGHFDENGHYVEHKEEDDPTMKDAWLTSEDAGVVSEEVRRKVEVRQAQMAAAEAAPEITPLQAADLIREVLAILQPQETVNRALRRLRPQQPPANRKAKKKDAAQEGKKELTLEEREAKAAFEKLTELASTLMDAGELDIYTTPREVLDVRQREHPAEKDDFDMFGGDDDEDAKAAPATSVREEGQAPPASGGQAPTAKPAAVAQSKAAEAEVDYASWPIKELTRFLKERGHNPAAIIDKADLVAKVKEVASQGPEGEQPATPPGYVWDPSSSLFYSSESGMYYDATSRGFYTPHDGKWWTYDEASGAFNEMAAKTA